MAHVITHLEIGGAQIATLAQVERSRFATGLRVLLAAPRGGLLEKAGALDHVRFAPISTLDRQIWPHRDMLALVHMIRVLRRLPRPLLVHTHSPKAGVLGRIAARAVGAELVVHSFHGFGHGRGSAGKFLGGVEHLSSRLADGYTVDSQANQRQGVAEGLFARRPVRVVHCGVDTEAFQFDPVARRSVRQEFGLGEAEYLVVTLANFKAQKDPMTFLRVAARVCRQRDDIRFVYAGDGPLRGQVEDGIQSEGLQGRVRLLGWRRDPARLLSGADLFFLSSRWEGLPQTFAQAMSTGLPIVATRVDGAPEAIEDGENGFLAAAGDVDALASAVLRCATDRKRSRELGMVGKARAERFSERTMLRTLDGFYRELAGRKRRA